MELNELEADLPNGFHDSLIASMSRNFLTGSLELGLEVLVSTPEDDSRGSRSLRRPATLRFTDVVLLISEAPNGEAPFRLKGPLNFVVTEGEAEKIPNALIENTSDGQRIFTFFIQEWLSEMTIVAADLNFEWAD